MTSPLSNQFPALPVTLIQSPNSETSSSVEEKDLPSTSESHTSPPTSASTSERKKNAHESAEESQRNYLRLYDKGSEILLNPKVQRKFDEYYASYNNSQTFDFQISSPEDLVAARLCIEKVIHRDVLHFIRGQFESYHFKLLPSDLQYFKKSGDILRTLRELNVISQADVINRDFFNQVNPLTILEAKFDSITAKKIYDVLYCVNYRSSDEAIFLRISDTKLLLPWVFSEMSQKTISVEETSLLFASLAFAKSKKKIPVIDPKTGELEDNVQSILGSKQKTPLVSVKDTTLISAGISAEDFFEKEFCKLSSFSFKAIQYSQEVNAFIREQFKFFIPFVDPSFAEAFFKDLDINTHFQIVTLHHWFFQIDSWGDKWSKLLYKILPDELLIKFDECKDIIHNYLRIRLPEIDQYIREKSPKSEEYDTLLLTYEGMLKQEKGSQIDLSALFEKYEHIIPLFLSYSVQKFSLSHLGDKKPKYDVNWELDGVKFTETFSLENSCVYNPRIQFPVDPQTKAGERTDLVYFSNLPEQDSITTKWETLKRRHRLNDRKLANYCLQLYLKGHIETHPEIKEFIAPLVVLLLGKEPALDRASLLSNFILLLSVQRGINTFKNALKKMPMIPQGAVSAKQFLRHVVRPLDGFSFVKYKNSNKSNGVPRSYFLTLSGDLLGNAEQWIERYDDVVTTCVECCVQFLNQTNITKDDSDSSITNLKLILEKFYNRSIPIDGLGAALEREGSLLDLKDIIGGWAIDYVFKWHPLNRT